MLTAGLKRKDNGAMGSLGHAVWIGLCIMGSQLSCERRSATSSIMAREAAPRTSASTGAEELVGLWKATRGFGPDERGPVVLERGPDGWSADFMGRRHPVRATGSALAFELPNERGSFLGHLLADGRSVRGHWTSARSVLHGRRYAAPVILLAEGAGRWTGRIEPREDTCTMYLMVTKRDDGTVGAFLRNPERNLGVFYDVDHLAREGNVVNLLDKGENDKPPAVVLRGMYDPDDHRLSVVLASRGGTYDFRPDTEKMSAFYARGKAPEHYAYRPPLSRDDGWPAATVESESIDRRGIERFVQRIIDMPIDSVHTPEVEGVLIARHGKLVVEEYFHGFDRDRLRETRSAAKSITATVVGAAMQAGGPVSLSSAVYQVMNGGTFPADLEPAKHAMTLENLLTMRSGFFCDGRNPDAPGNEDRMLDQSEEPDYHRYTLRLPLDRKPGEKGMYCAVAPNLALGVVGRAMRESPLNLFDRLIADPLKISGYAWPLSPAGQPYGGGGVQLLPRDFLKIAQMMLNGGTWGNHRILSRDFAKSAASPLHDLRSLQYGYLWWSIAYPYKDRSVRGFFCCRQRWTSGDGCP
jgi:CubicO group peptidase (beta-lactamase class C family)